jgi:hypothetical protein
LALLWISDFKQEIFLVLLRMSGFKLEIFLILLRIFEVRQGTFQVFIMHIWIQIGNIPGFTMKICSNAKTDNEEESRGQISVSPQTLHNFKLIQLLWFCTCLKEITSELTYTHFQINKHSPVLSYPFNTLLERYKKLSLQNLAVFLLLLFGL